jgi:predicted SprT family Zn-dependent metalloprotease
LVSYKKWVRQQVENIRDYLHLYEWRLGIAFDDKDQDDGNTSTVAYINVNSDYFKATVTLLPFAERMFRDKQYETLMQCIVHEVCHIWTDPMLQLARKSASPNTVEYVTTAHEQLTQRVALLALRGIPEKSYLP